MGEGQKRDGGGPGEGLDVALVHGPTADGEGANVIRVKDGELSLGELRPHREGDDLRGRELVRLHARPDRPALCDVEVLHDGRGAPPTKGRSEKGRQGPARVSSPAYRRGWGQVFSGARRAAPGGDHSLN